jgi:hypothetical protein
MGLWVLANVHIHLESMVAYRELGQVFDET